MYSELRQHESEESWFFPENRPNEEGSSCAYFGRCAVGIGLFGLFGVWICNQGVSNDLSGEWRVPVTDSPTTSAEHSCVYEPAQLFTGATSSCTVGEQYSAGHKCEMTLAGHLCQSTSCALSGDFGLLKPLCSEVRVATTAQTPKPTAMINTPSSSPAATGHATSTVPKRIASVGESNAHPAPPTTTTAPAPPLVFVHPASITTDRAPTSTDRFPAAKRDDVPAAANSRITRTPHLGKHRKTFVVMADTRELSPKVPASFALASWEQISAVVNMKYAERNGYKFVHFHMGHHALRKQKSPISQWKSPTGDDNVGCKHPVFGMRHPSWCKLLAIFHALKSEGELPLSDEDADPMVMYVDSDMVFNQPSVTIAQYLARSPVCKIVPQISPRLKRDGYPLTAQVQSSGCDEECVSSRRNATLMVNLDPNGSFGNCGMQLWRSRDDAHAVDLLSDWWNLNNAQHNIEFPWEQYTFNRWLWPQNETRIKIIQDTDEFSNPMFDLNDGFLKHVVSFQGAVKRKQHLLAVAEQMYRLSLSDFQEGYRKVLSEHHSTLSSIEMEALSEELARDTASIKALSETPWAADPHKYGDKIYQLMGQDGYTQVMAVPLTQRKAKYLALLAAYKKNGHAVDHNTVAEPSSALKLDPEEDAQREAAKYADKIYQLMHQDGYNQVMAVPVSQRKAKYLALLAAYRKKKREKEEPLGKEAVQDAAAADAAEAAEAAIMDVQDAAEAAEAVETVVDDASETQRADPDANDKSDTLDPRYAQAMHKLRENLDQVNQLASPDSARPKALRAASMIRLKRAAKYGLHFIGDRAALRVYVRAVEQLENIHEPQLAAGLNHAPSTLSADLRARVLATGLSSQHGPVHVYDKPPLSLTFHESLAVPFLKDTPSFQAASRYVFVSAPFSATLYKPGVHTYICEPGFNLRTEYTHYLSQISKSMPCADVIIIATPAALNKQEFGRIKHSVLTQKPVASCDACWKGTGPHSRCSRYAQTSSGIHRSNELLRDVVSQLPRFEILDVYQLTRIMAAFGDKRLYEGGGDYGAPVLDSELEGILSSIKTRAHEYTNKTLTGSSQGWNSKACLVLRSKLDNRRQIP